MVRLLPKKKKNYFFTWIFVWIWIFFLLLPMICVSCLSCVCFFLLINMKAKQKKNTWQNKFGCKLLVSFDFKKKNFFLPFFLKKTKRNKTEFVHIYHHYAHICAYETSTTYAHCSSFCNKKKNFCHMAKYQKKIE